MAIDIIDIVIIVKIPVILQSRLFSSYFSDLPYKPPV